MEPNSTSGSDAVAEAPATPATPPVNQVMDVVPPPASAPASDDALPDDLAIPPPDDNPDTTKPKDDKSSSPAHVPKPVTPRKSGNGSTAAIVATVVIVLGLAALAVFAYIKTK